MPNSLPITPEYVSKNGEKHYSHVNAIKARRRDLQQRPADEIPDGVRPIDHVIETRTGRTIPIIPSGITHIGAVTAANKFLADERGE